MALPKTYSSTRVSAVYSTIKHQLVTYEPCQQVTRKDIIRLLSHSQHSGATWRHLLLGQSFISGQLTDYLISTTVFRVKFVD